VVNGKRLKHYITGQPFIKKVEVIHLRTSEEVISEKHHLPETPESIKGNFRIVTISESRKNSWVLIFWNKVKFRKMIGRRRVPRGILTRLAPPSPPGRARMVRTHLRTPFLPRFVPNSMYYSKTTYINFSSADLISHRVFSRRTLFFHAAVLQISLCQTSAMSSGDSFQCTSIDDDDDAQGLSPTMWRNNRKRKDYSDEEDKEEEQDYDEAGSEEKLKPISIVVVRVMPTRGSSKKNTRMSTRGKAPRHCLASKNIISNLNCREVMHVP
jgi:hypothetical protein